MVLSSGHGYCEIEIEIVRSPYIEDDVSDVYERLTPLGKKGGFKELMATQVTSALWHVSADPTPPHCLIGS